MDNAIIFHLEGLLATFNILEDRWVLVPAIVSKMSELKKENKIILITFLKQTESEGILKDLADKNIFDKIYFLRNLPFHKRSTIFDIIKKDFKIKKIIYFIGEVYPIFSIKKIIGFTKKIILHPEAILNPEKSINNSLISFDLDGVLNDISQYKYRLYELHKRYLEHHHNLKISIKDFPELWQNLDEKQKKDLEKKALLKYQETEQINKWVEDYLHRLSKSNKLVLFSVTSRRRIEYFLKEHKLSNFFSKIYSAKDDFNKKIKEVEMFEKIKKDNPEYTNFVHIGDNYELDYLSAKKAGFKSYLVDNSPYEKILLKNL